jgi:ferredoxin
MLKVVADKTLCVGSGMCAMTAPVVFDQDGTDGRVVVLTDRPESDQEEATREAVYLCPTGALSLLEEV